MLSFRNTVGFTILWYPFQSGRLGVLHWKTKLRAMWRTTNQEEYQIPKKPRIDSCNCLGHPHSNVKQFNHSIVCLRKPGFYEQTMIDHYFHTTFQMDICRKETIAMKHPFDVSNSVWWNTSIESFYTIFNLANLIGKRIRQPDDLDYDAHSGCHLPLQ